MNNNQTTTVTLNINGKEAEEELSKLKKRAEDLKNTWAKLANEKGIDNKKVREIKKEINETEREIRKMDKSLHDVNNVLNNLESAKPRELQRAMKQLEAALNSSQIQRGSEQWKAYQQQLMRVKTELQNIKAESKETQSWIDRFNDGMNRWQTTIAAAVAAIMGLYQAMLQIRSNAFAKEDAQANLAAITGLDAEDIDWLQKKAVEMATTMDETGLRVRQSSNEIIDAMRLVGANKPELLQDKEGLAAVTKEVLRLSQAATMDLNQATLSLATSLNQFGQGADSAAKYVNALAAGSRFGAADVSNLGKVILRSGVAANMAHIPFEQLVGAAEALAESGLKGERAGTGLKTFLMRLETGAEETRPSVVGLDKALEELAKHAEDAKWMKSKFGMVATNVAVTLAKGADRVKYYTKAVTDTKVAEEQAAIVGATAAAKHAQLSNQLKEIGIDFFNKVGPAILYATRGVANWTRVVIQFLNWASEYKATILVLVGSLAAYNIGLNAVIIKQKLLAFWNGVVLKSFLALKGAMSVSNIFATIGIAAATLIIYLVEMKSKIKEVTLAQKELEDGRRLITEEYAKEEAKIDRLRGMLDKENIARHRKLEIIKELKKLMPDYYAELDKEGHVIRENSKAIKNYLSMKEKQIELKVWEDKHEQLYQKLLQKQLEYRNWIENLNNSTYGTAKKGEQFRKEIQDLKDAIVKVKKEYDKLLNDNNLKIKVEQIDSEETDPLSDSELKKIANLEKQKAQTEAEERKKVLAERYANEEISEREHLEKTLQVDVDMFEKIKGIWKKYLGENTAEYIDAVGDEIKARREMVLKLMEFDNKEKESVEKKTQKEINDIDRLINKYQESTEKLEEDYDRLVAAYLNNQVNDVERYMQAMAFIQKKYAQRWIAEEKEKWAKSRAELNAYMQMFGGSRRNESLNVSSKISDLNIKENSMKNQAALDLEEGVIDEKTYQQQILDIEREFANARKNIWADYYKTIGQMEEKFVSQVSSMLGTIGTLQKANGDLEVARAEKRYDEEIKIAKKKGKDTTKLEEEKEKEINQIKKKYAIKQEKIQIAQALTNVAQSITKTLAEWGWPWGAAFAAMSAAEGAMQVATIRKQTQAQIAGYYDGGYTEGDNYHKAAGIVHQGEFVSNHQAVNNPYLRNVFDLIDQAQKRNTVGSITDEDIALANARRYRGYMNGGYVNPNSISFSPKISVQKDDNYEKLAKAIEMLCDEGIEATVAMTGPKGLVEQNKKYNKLISNKSR